jgi:hypothetical protein
MIYDALLRGSNLTYDEAVWLAAQGLGEALKFPTFTKLASSGDTRSDPQSRWFLHNLMLRYLQNVKVAGYSPADDDLAVRIVHHAVAEESDTQFTKFASASPAAPFDLWEKLSDEKKFFLLTGLPQLVYERVKRGSFDNFVGAVIATMLDRPHIAKAAGARFSARAALKPLAIEVCRLSLAKS